MFSKAYKLKSNNTLKNSEKKQLAQRIMDNFSTATEEKVKELVPTKSNASCMRIITHSGDTVAVYVVDGEPMILEMADRLCPTLCALWKLPDLLPIITIHSLVLGKIQGGAPLYLPGVSIPVQGRGFPMFSRGATIAINTESNSSPAAVGTALMSSGDMLLHGNGVCLETIHVLGDFLCKDIKFNKITRPARGPASYSISDDQRLPDISPLNIRHQAQSKEEWPELGSEKYKRPPENEEPKVIPDKEMEKEEIPCEDPLAQTETQELILSEELDRFLDEKEDEDRIPEDMDGLLRWCLLSFLKQEGRKLNLPLKTNLLYKNHLMPLCPPGRALDVKKSTYKKMGKFLDAMQKEGLIETREIEKGVSALTSVNVNHPAVRAHTTSVAASSDSRETTAEVERNYTPPVVRELFSVTAPTVPVLLPHKKGTALTAAEARSALTAYVRARNLQDPADPRRLRLDQPLAALLNVPAQNSASWEEVWGAVCGRMTACTELRFADGAVTLLRTRMPPVGISVATRSGNKKVTLVSNLEPYGFNLAALSRVWQARAAAAVTITQTPSSTRPQILLQGDQVLHELHYLWSKVYTFHSLFLTVIFQIQQSPNMLITLNTQIEYRRRLLKLSVVSGLANSALLKEMKPIRRTRQKNH